MQWKQAVDHVALSFVYTEILLQFVSDELS